MCFVLFCRFSCVIGTVCSVCPRLLLEWLVVSVRGWFVWVSGAHYPGDFRRACVPFPRHVNLFYVCDKWGDQALH